MIERENISPDAGLLLDEARSLVEGTYGFVLPKEMQQAFGRVILQLGRDGVSKETENLRRKTGLLPKMAPYKFSFHRKAKVDIL